VSDSHDRYANAQTNFLLQRIEDYTGVAILATNSRDRFDAAFARRLDMVLEFPLPDSAARRQLWDRHLGRDHAVPDEWLDAIAGSVDLAGGHIRNVVLAAAARARVGERPIEARDLAAAIGEEYAKLGRTAQPLPRC
jgi:SpoVK/Ycf46/Vps4 family AAA+-type ATPase